MPGPRPYRVSKRKIVLDSVRGKLAYLAAQVDGVVAELQRPQADDPALARTTLAEARKLQKKIAACL